MNNNYFDKKKFIVWVFLVLFCLWGFKAFSNERQNILNSSQEPVNNENLVEPNTIAISQDLSLNSNQCKAGYNPGKINDVEKIGEANGGFGSIVTIVESYDVPSTTSFISTANEYGLIPIVRLCTKNSDKDYCGDFKSADSTAKFLVELSNGIEADDKFVFMAGPNEPISERWISRDASFLDSDKVPVTQNDKFRNYFVEVGKYTRSVYDRANSGIRADRRANVKIIGQALNLDFEGCGKQSFYMDAYIEGLGGDLNSIDGLAGNTYNKGDVRADTCYDFIRDNYIVGKVDDDFGFYFTEFGPFGQDQKKGLNEAYATLAGYPEVKYINFFTPFGSADSEFAKHALSLDEIKEITKCDLKAGSKITVKGGGNVRPNEIVRNVPYAPYYLDKYKAYEMQSCEKLPTSSNTLSSWHRLWWDGDNNLVGYKIVTAKVKSFPGLDDFGSVTSEDQDINLNSEKFSSQAISPYDPICNILARTLGTSGLTFSNEHAGIMSLNTKDGGKLNIAVPKLGNGIGCLNLILHPTLILSDINDPSQYVGFNLVDLSQNDQNTALQNDEDSLQNLFGRTAVDLSYVGTINQISTGISDLLSRFTPDKYVRPLQTHEPVTFYKDVDYCAESPNYSGPPIKHINVTASEPSESLESGEEIVAFEEFHVGLGDYCNSDGSTLNTSNGSNAKDDLCTFSVYDKTYKPKSPELIQNITDRDGIYVVSNTDGPESVSIPGAISGYAKLYERVQTKASALNHRLIAPFNGTIVEIEMKVYDPFRSSRSDLAKVKEELKPIDFKNPVKILTKTEYQDIPFQIAKAPFDSDDRSSSGNFQFVIPFDLQPYFIQSGYNYSLSDQSTDYFIEWNDILIQKGYIYER